MEERQVLQIATAERDEIAVLGVGEMLATQSLGRVGQSVNDGGPARGRRPSARSCGGSGRG